MHHADTDLETVFRSMLLIRRFEERVLDLFAEGALNGTTHTYVGQEAIGVGVISCLADNDIVVTNHRCHGHYLARFADPVGLLAEMMGKSGGICGGRGGSQHLHREGFYSNGVQGGFLPIAAGMALALRRQSSDAIVCAFIGDGTLGEGTVYETLNMVALWGIPLLIVLENNRYAQTTPIELAVAGDIAARAAAFGISTSETSSADVAELRPIFDDIVSTVRTTGKPHFHVANTLRFRAHSKGDDHRDPEELAGYAAHDPILLSGRHLPADILDEVEADVATEVDNAIDAAFAMPDAGALGGSA